jgi:hypothetical protein
VLVSIVLKHNSSTKNPEKPLQEIDHPYIYQ